MQEKEIISHILSAVCGSSCSGGEGMHALAVELKVFFAGHGIEASKVLDALKKESASLKRKITIAKRKYYLENHTNAELSDSEYDNLVVCLSLLERFSIEFTLQTEGAQQSLISNYDNENLFATSQNIVVGVATKGAVVKSFGVFGKLAHYEEMLSLGNVFNQEEMQDFLEKINRFLGIKEDVMPEFCCELKIDGLSFSAVYEKGILKYVATRGDGKIGENVTKNISQIDGFPERLNDTHPPSLIEIRGEVFMKKSVFREINKMLPKPFVNPRNAAAGSLRQLDAEVTKQRKLSYFAYAIGDVKGVFGVKTQSGLLKQLKEWGFVVNDVAKVVSNKEDLIHFYQEQEGKRLELDYDVDGLVAKVNSFDLQKRLGRVSNCPRWAVAYKFSSEIGLTIIKDIECQVGRTGAITPVAILEDISIGGVVVSRATLHNFEEISKKDIRIGDAVFIKRSGDVIPKIIEVAKNKERGVKAYVVPEVCPSCKTTLVKEKEEDVVLRCPNRHGCRDQQIDSIIHFVSRMAFDIYGLGRKQVEKFFDLGILQSYVDIFKIKEKSSQILNLEGWGKKSFDNLIENIEQKRKVSLERFIYSLGIRHIGEVSSQMLAEYFVSLQNLKDFMLSGQTVDEKTNTITAKIDGFGEMMICGFVEFAQDAKSIHNLIGLLDFVTVLDFDQESSSTSLGNGRAVLFTGSLTTMTRQEAKEKAKSAGFKLASGISSDLSYLIVGEKAGSKLKKAQEVGVKIITEEEWVELLKNPEKG